MFCLFCENFLQYCAIWSMLSFQSASGPAFDMNVVDSSPIDKQPNGSASQMNVRFGPESTKLQCPQCHANVSTRTQIESSMQTHVVAAMLLPTICCWILPYCFKSCKNVHHYCPRCNQYLHTFRR